jgi:hypothetical protein
MSLQVYRTTFTQQSGTGDQVVTDAGLTFTPVAARVTSSSHVTNSGGFAIRIGFAMVNGNQQGVATNAGDFLGTYEASETAVSDGTYAFVTVRNSAANQINALGYFKAWATGSYTVHWDQNSSGWSTGVIWHVEFFGGSGITADVGRFVPQTSIGNQTFTLGISAPVVLFASFSPIGSGNASANGGNAFPMHGMVTACGTPDQGASTASILTDQNPSVEYSFQTTTQGLIAIKTDGSGPLVAGTVTGFGGSSTMIVNWTTPSPSSNSCYFPYLALGGPMAANFVTLTQPTSTGTQATSYRVQQPQAVLVTSTNKVASGSIVHDCFLTLGSATATAQGHIWAGDTYGKAPAAWAVEVDANMTNVFDAYHPTSSSTAVTDVIATLTSLNVGSMFWDWGTVDSTARQVIGVVLGSDTVGVCGGATPIVTTTRYMRRVRRFPLPFNQNMWLFLQRLEVLIQSGVGRSTGQGSDPVLMLRLSRDGGQTWGNEIEMGMGKMGQYDFRAYCNRLGRGRNWVAEINDTDPVFAALLVCYVDIEEGTS